MTGPLLTYLDTLNPAQRQAVIHQDGPLLVLAGAGAGKTRVITYRILNLIHHGATPAEILAITFTNKAAAEMRERVHALLAAERISGQSLPTTSTFHALGVQMLRAHAELAGLPRHFSIYDRSDALKAIRRAVAECDLDAKQWQPQRLLGLISRQKGEGISATEFTAREHDYVSEVVAKVWRTYEKILTADNALDFDDLLLRPVQLLKENSSLRDYYHDRFKYLHVDEYQDTNGIQYAMTQLLVSPAENICAVGDADQTIYTWRGAQIDNILNFQRDYPRAAVVTLEQNYRSTKTILAAANQAIAKNQLRAEKNLFTDNADGEQISLIYGMDESDEARQVAERAGTILQAGTSDIAVLYRANFQSRALEQAFLDANVPYQMLGTRFFERREVKDLLSYLRAALNPDSSADIARIINVPKRGIGKITIDRLLAGKREELSPAIAIKVEKFFALLKEIRQQMATMPPSKVVQFVLAKSGMEEMLKSESDGEERLENAQELVTLALKYDNLADSSDPDEERGSTIQGIEKLLEDAALVSDQDNLNKETAGVKLMTIHAAKGLEFDTVFITGLEQGLFPHEKDSANRAEAEEERRLFYVALTRARHKVWLSSAAVRTIFGSRQPTLPSEFLAEIDPLLVDSEIETAPQTKTNYLDIEW
jgi:DNA helicase-2/ATP-dependent DNA helicase PcrA